MWGGVSPSSLRKCLGRGCAPPEKKIDFRSQIGEFWNKMGALCTVHIKLVLRSWERRSHCQNDWERRFQTNSIVFIVAYLAVLLTCFTEQEDCK